MPIRFRSRIRSAFQLVGLDIHRYRTSRLPARPSFFDLYRVEAIFDIGASVGMSAEGFRSNGFCHTIVSFEPISSLYEELERRSRSDPLWHTERLALGNSQGYEDIYVTGGQAGSSSLLAMTNNMVINAPPDQHVIRAERVPVSTIDQVISKYYPAGDRLFLKIDVQGYERRVLEGAKDSMPRIVGMKLELSLVENYQGESLLHEMLPRLYDLGFHIVGIEDAWGNRGTGEIYQVDITCFRPERAGQDT